jgi:hypothetical protein
MTSGNNPREATAAKAEFVRQLRAAADRLKPLVTTPVLTDSYALMWWALLGSMAELIEAQDGPINLNQKKFLRTSLFGGMGSLIDYDSGLTPQLWKAFQALEPPLN